MSKKDYPEDSLGNRIKEYEASTTEQYFMRGLPLYARLDGRAFHTFTRGFGVPYPNLPNTDTSFQVLMCGLCAKLVKETSASLGYVQSDEISLGWTDVSKAPFDRRVFKLTSVLASLAGSNIMKLLFNEFDNENYVHDPRYDKIRARALKSPPSFDCRVFQVPDLMELANCFVWRENDAIKNSISSYSLEFFSARELVNKKQTDRLEMLRAAGHPWENLLSTTQRGAYYARRLYKIANEDGTELCTRSRVEHVLTGHTQLAKIENKVGYLFGEEEPVPINRSNNGGDARTILIDGRIPNDVHELISDFPNTKEVVQ